MVKLLITLLFTLPFFFSCERTESLNSKKVKERQKTTGDGPPPTPPSEEDIIPDPGERYQFTLSLVKDFGQTSISGFNDNSLRIHEMDNGLLGGYFEFTDTLNDWAILFISDKEGKVIKSQRFLRSFRRMDQIIMDRFGNIYLRGAPRISGPADEVIQKFNYNFELQWQSNLTQLDQSGVLMFLKRNFLYFLTHTGGGKKEFAALKIDPFTGTVIKRTVHPNLALPQDLVFSTAITPVGSSIQLDNDTFHYIYKDKSDDNIVYGIYIRYSFDTDEFLVDREIDLNDEIDGRITVCHDQAGGFFTFQSFERLSVRYNYLTRYNALGEIIYRHDINDELLPHIDNGGLNIRCQNNDIELFGTVEMNEVNSTNIIITSRFSKLDGSIIKSHLLEMRERETDVFHISSDINGRYHFYEPEHKPAVMDYDIHFSGVNF